ncbi:MULTISPECIES: hypothetical protein [Clostridium]|uniref:Uncharacterized protein n=3 Tax=Clostridium TaxID=1485 RepID=D8GQ37_CLOLD|nr:MULTISPECIES: hypothetical protein [Clostridium]ADK16128.1 hypothetical protein CLJU_c30800 [Clostridium ljungdahlii DSM 13528]AGY75309.1 hypothetical protein CAETHG_1084 [Clostridium autoethanogenum DSM 10061]ALU35475.1 Hypothetical protein CLAU_1046 [Clostridium autoethanogenum DSM 10061]OAA84212.1 hypothetical protein WX45_01848 [Clostridium ljungdahlii DSM 13528]OAA84231.1 hypothetical protein WX73_03508 [Clostridium coskatii]
MNSQARDNIHKVKESLKSAQQGLQMAANEVENSNIKNQINTQLNQVSTCLDECEKIASGLSQYKNYHP